MTSQSVDTVIIGGGLAGVTLAWQLLAKRQSIAVIDTRTIGQASRVAAGLITPVTGKNLKPEPGFEEMRGLADAFYASIESTLSVEFYGRRPAYRRLNEIKTLNRWASDDAALKQLAHTATTQTPLRTESDDIVIEMPLAGRLNTQRYLEESENYLSEKGVWKTGLLCDEDLDIKQNGIHLPRFGLTASRAIFCRGWRDRDNSWFKPVKWRPARGQIIAVKASDLPSSHTLHGQGIWITHDRDTRFLCGATYEWDGFEDAASDSVTNRLAQKLRTLIEPAFEVVDQCIGVRPIVSARKPLAGMSSTEPRIGLLNGLGSKGALYAPMLAKCFAEHIVDGAPIPAPFDLNQRVD